MCLAFLAAGIQEEIPLILMFNRDEDFERISMPIHFWAERRDVIGGFDVSTGGTWAGIRTDGRFAMLTFVREPRLAMTPSKRRGQIAREYLLADVSPAEFAEALERERDLYLGYNVVLGDRNGSVHYNNRSGSRTELKNGLFGISNADLDTPWVKVVRGKHEISEILKRVWRGTEALWQVLENQERAAIEETQVTGLPLEREWSKSSIFVREPNYGTRSSSIVLFHRSGEIEFTERTYGREAVRRAEVTIRV